VTVGRSRLFSLAGAIGLVVLMSCASAGPATVPTPFQKIRVVPEPRTGAFVVPAIDNHFHDIHPSDKKRIQEDRPLIIKNYGLYLHNFTVQGTNIDVDVPPGGEVSWPRIGTILPRGHYFAFCKYHVSAGMAGEFDVVP
jgi:hypothetical protein